MRHPAPVLSAAATLALAAALPAQTPSAPRAYELTVLTEDVLRLRVDEGYVVHHGQGERATEDQLLVTPFDGAGAQAAGLYTVTAAADPDYAAGRAPLSVARKTKPSEFASFCDEFGADPSGRFGASRINRRPDRANEHFLYLRLPAPSPTASPTRLPRDSRTSPRSPSPTTRARADRRPSTSTKSATSPTPARSTATSTTGSETAAGSTSAAARAPSRSWTRPPARRPSRGR